MAYHSCTICLNLLHEKAGIGPGPEDHRTVACACGHMYHAKCVLRYSPRDVLCPACKVPGPHIFLRPEVESEEQMDAEKTLADLTAKVVELQGKVITLEAENSKCRKSVADLGGNLESKKELVSRLEAEKKDLNGRLSFEIGEKLISQEQLALASTQKNELQQKLGLEIAEKELVQEEVALERGEKSCLQGMLDLEREERKFLQDLLDLERAEKRCLPESLARQSLGKEINRLPEVFSNGNGLKRKLDNAQDGSGIVFSEGRPGPSTRSRNNEPLTNEIKKESKMLLSKDVEMQVDPDPSARIGNTQMANKIVHKRKKFFRKPEHTRHFEEFILDAKNRDAKMENTKIVRLYKETEEYTDMVNDNGGNKPSVRSMYNWASDTIRAHNHKK